MFISFSTGSTPYSSACVISCCRFIWKTYKGLVIFMFIFSYTLHFLLCTVCATALPVELNVLVHFSVKFDRAALMCVLICGRRCWNCLKKYGFRHCPPLLLNWERRYVDTIFLPSHCNPPPVRKWPQNVWENWICILSYRDILLLQALIINSSAFQLQIYSNI